ncbi:ATP-binding cassette domain-containing protein [Nesterenkonia halotolerans]|uniref:Energy-coupling factor transport system ATP-binding protein n=1 Tax=Nesterenkonia halotolerans TaxID=225325 RepID=A0ABR9J887_9MICC|nr:ABC transporter ATP-binding protein [Nesterenkonia halotolerans]MBE1515203.1 energy-coupling factor transport system ATP-binding protein [Nesterenkonia halotolerans]
MPEHAPLPSSSAPPSPPVLTLREFGFTYRGSDDPALTGVDLMLHPGEAVAVLGPQGAGTSTLARAVARLLGEHGESTGSREATDDGIGMLGDDPEAQVTGLSRTVREEAALPGRLIGLPLQDCLARAAVSLETLGITALAERELSTLSGGERQLTALASLLTLHPRVLVLDQASQSLDHSARRRLARSLRQFRATGGAVLLTGHQHDELSVECDRVLFLDEKRLSAGGLMPSSVTPVQLAAHGIWDARHEVHTPLNTPVHLPNSARGPGHEVLLRVRDLSVHRASVQVLDGVELDLRAGEVTALLGANGSGKSTLLGSLAGLVPSGAGASILGPGGVELAAEPAHRRANHIAWVGQDPGDQLSASTVHAELMRAAPLGPGGRRLKRADRLQAKKQRELDVQRVMEMAGLTAHAEDHPYDLQPAQRKDCVIASALLMNPAVLLLDEPTLGRDAAGMARLSHLLRSFTSAGGAVLVATHDRRWAAEVGDHQLRLVADHLLPDT